MSTTTAAPRIDRDGTESSKAASFLFEQHRPRIFAFCLSRTRNRSDAEDATQTTFMYALSGLRRGVVPEFELSWLLKIAENVCHSQRRRAHRRYERDELPADVTSDHGGDPAVISERLETIASALELLPEPQRRAIVLREWRGLSYHDIAAELRTSHAAVETLLFRARRSLLKQVAGFGTAALEAARLVRGVLGAGAVKAAIVGASAVTVGVGVAADRPAATIGEPATARFAEHTARAPARAEEVRPNAVEVPGVTRAERNTAVPLGLPAEPAAAAGQPQEQPSSGAAANPDTTGAATPSPSSPAGSAPKEVVPLVDLDEPLAGIGGVLEPVEQVVDAPLDLVPALEPAVPEVELPVVEIVEQLPGVTAPELPQLPLPPLP